MEGFIGSLPAPNRRGEVSSPGGLGDPAPTKIHVLGGRGRDALPTDDGGTKGTLLPSPVAPAQLETAATRFLVGYTGAVGKSGYQFL